MELVRSINQTMIKTVTRVQMFYFFCNNRIIQFRRLLPQRCRKYHTLSFLDWHFEVTGHQQVFCCTIPSLSFFRVVESSIPVRMVMKFILHICLHIQIRIAIIQAHLDSILYGRISRIRHTVFLRPLAYAAEGQEGFKPKRSLRMSL